MALTKSDYLVLMRATLRLYLDCVIEAGRAVWLNWRVLGLHFVALFAFGIVNWLLGMLFGHRSVFSGFALGLLLAYLVSGYLSSVVASVDREKYLFSSAFSRANELFGPVIGVLFCFFILNSVAGIALNRPEQLWIRYSLNLVLAVLFNPIPEVVSQRSCGLTEAFGESLEFVKENSVEWFVPFVVLLLPVLLVNPGLFLSVGLMIAANNPLMLLEVFFNLFSSPLILISSSPLLILLLICIYYVFVFRGLLYRQLAASTRRKRIFQEKAR